MTTLYRLLTGPDDAHFCHKVSAALANGWQLYGPAVYAHDPASGTMRCAQAVIKDTEEPYDANRKLGDY